MKLFSPKLILAILAIAALCLPAKAQRSWDLFSAPRTVVIQSPLLLDTSAATFTNSAVDIRVFDGIATIFVTSFTNAGGALTVTPENSADQTNWTALANYAVSKSATVTYTNTYYGGTNLTATDTYLLPGTLTAPTAATAGFATSYLLPQQFTNSGALTITAKGTYLIGFNAGDAQRYIHLIFTPTGASSNDVVAATMIGMVHGEVK